VQSNNNDEAQALKQPGRASNEISESYPEPQVVQILKSNNFLVDGIDFQKDKAQIWAAENGHEAVVQYLILEYPGRVDFTKMDALYGAAKSGHTPVIDPFLDFSFIGAKRKYCAFRTDPPYEVAKSRNEACMKKLLDAGADVKAICNHGQTALHEASACQNLAVMRILLEHKAPLGAVDSSGETALHLAAQQGHTAAVKLLLYWGISVMR
jgi:ankyrin repeat protein